MCNVGVGARWVDHATIADDGPTSAPRARAVHLCALQGAPWCEALAQGPTRPSAEKTRTKRSAPLVSTGRKGRLGGVYAHLPRPSIQSRHRPATPPSRPLTSRAPGSLPGGAGSKALATSRPSGAEATVPRQACADAEESSRGHERRLTELDTPSLHTVQDTLSSAGSGLTWQQSGRRRARGASAWRQCAEPLSALDASDEGGHSRDHRDRHPPPPPFPRRDPGRALSHVKPGQSSAVG